MRAGSAQIDITPEPGRAVLGQRMRRTAESVHDPLYASALALESRGEALILVACDLALVDDPPSILGLLGTNTDMEYRQQFPEWAARAAISAWQRREEAVLGFAAGRTPGWTFPRRYWMQDGNVRMHPLKGSPEIVRPEGVADSELGVIWTRAAGSGRLIGALVNFGCHPIVVGGEGLFSADFPGAIRAAIQQVEGPEAAVLFGNGACGDTSPFEVERPDKSERGFAWMEQMGSALASRAQELMATGTLESDPLLHADHCFLEVATRAPAREAVSAAWENMGDRSPDIEPTEREFVAPRETLLWEREREPTARLELSVARIGPGMLVTLPGELFASLGLRIKAAAPRRPCLVIELANGYCGYLPTEEAFLGGGYETELARSSKLVPAAGPAVVEAAMDLLRRLSASCL